MACAHEGASLCVYIYIYINKYIYIYIYTYLCVCVCLCLSVAKETVPDVAGLDEIPGFRALEFWGSEPRLRV